MCHLEGRKEAQLGLRAVEERSGEGEKGREEEREARKAEVRERAIKTSH